MLIRPAIIAAIPTPPSLTFDFLSNTYVGGTVNATTPAGYAPDSTGKLTLFAGNVPRRTDKGLLVEPSVKNILINSNGLSSWTNNNLTLTQNTTGPDGTSNVAWTLVDNHNGIDDITKTTVIPNDSSNYCLSSYIKKAPSAQSVYPGMTLAVSGGSGVSRTTMIDTFTGAFTDQNVVGSTGVRDLGAYWLWWLLIPNNSSGNTNLVVNIYPALTATWGNVSRQNAATGQNVFAFLQVAAGSQSLSYVPTTSSGVTQAADVVTTSGSISLDTSGGASLHVVARSGSGVSALVALQADEGDDTNSIAIIRDSAREARVVVTVGGSQVANLDLGLWADESQTSVAVSVQGSTLIASRNGLAPVSATLSSTLGTLTNLRFGAASSGPTAQVWIERVDVWNSALQ